MRQMNATTLSDLDRAHWIHPVSALSGPDGQQVKALKTAQGAWITDCDGHRLLDGFSGLWCVNAGYGQQSLIDAATKQLAELPYATGYFGLGSEPAIRLAAALSDRAPGDLNHVYFTLGGSDAIDSTVRYAQLYWASMGAPERNQFISVENGYHGSSAMGAGLTALAAFHTGFDAPYGWQHKIPSHYRYRNPASDNDADIVAASVAQLRAKVEEIGADRVAAFYVEPIQGSGGVLTPPDGWLKAMQDACRALGILFVVDEVITGFGRTGGLFESAAQGLTPDFLTCAKGLTSGYVPMGAVFMSDRVFDVIAGHFGETAIGHGYTYSGHPVSAAVALAALDLYEGGLLDNGRARGAELMAGLHALSDHPLVGDVRGKGMLAAVEMVTDKTRKTPLPAAAAARIFDRAYANGLIVRAFANGALGFAPPLCCTPEDMAVLLERTERVLDQTLDDPDIRSAMKG